MAEERSRSDNSDCGISRDPILLVDSAMKGVAWITLLVTVGCSQLASTQSGSQQCEAMQRVAESAATSWEDAISAGDGVSHSDHHYCYSNQPCDEVTCIISRVRDRLRFILLRCSNPVAFRVTTESIVSLGKIDRINDFTFSKSVTVDFALISGSSRLVMNVTLEHFSDAIGLKMDLKQRVSNYDITATSLTFIPYTRIPFDSSSGCTPGPITSDIDMQREQDSSANSSPTTAIIIAAICVLCMVVIALATIMAVVLLVRKKQINNFGGRAEVAFQPLLTASSDADEEST